MSLRPNNSPVEAEDGKGLEAEYSNRLEAEKLAGQGQGWPKA
jgi:hypothetical protein